MLGFQPLTLDLIPLVKKDLARPLPRTCDYTPGGVLLWRDYFSAEYTLLGDSVLYRIRLPDGTQAFQAPADPDPALLIAAYEDCKARGVPCRFTFVPAERKDAFYSVFGEKNITAAPQREWYDYLYEKEDLIHYRGKKRKGQRNHVNKFCLTYPDWDFTRGTTEDLPRLREFYANFRKENQKDAPTWIEEEKKIEEIFSNFDRYGFLCGILTVNDRVVGFSLGEIQEDTLTVHTEKADRNIFGAYPMLTARFTEEFAGNLPQIRYVNREDDSGDEGLRNAKLSYHPCALLEKFFIEVF